MNEIIYNYLYNAIDNINLAINSGNIDKDDYNILTDVIEVIESVISISKVQKKTNYFLKNTVS